MASVLNGVRKIDLLTLASELGEVVNDRMRVTEIRQVIVDNQTFEVEFIKGLVATIVEDRIEREREREREKEREEREREREKEREEREREREEREMEKEERERERQFELEKMRIQSANAARDLAPERPNPVQSRHVRDFRNLMPNFSPEETDISLYLAMFERQARKAGLEDQDWVSNLMALLPMDIAQIILREPEEKMEDYPHIKGILLQRFRLSPEAFRAKFSQYQKRPGSLWKDFAFELRTYLEGWVKGVEVSTFEALLELMLTDQIKRRVGHEMRDHFIDDWGKLISTEELVRALDEYESVRRGSKKEINSNRAQEPLNSVSVRRKEISRPQNERPKIVTTSGHVGVVDFRDERRDEESFEKRRLPRCYECNSTQHLRPQCPKLINRGSTEVVNCLLGSSVDSLAAFMGTAKINGKRMSTLRDSGTTIDLIARNRISPNMYLNETVLIRQPLEVHATCLPLARIEIETEEGIRVLTKAAIVSSELDTGYYLLGNRTAELLRQAQRKNERRKAPRNDHCVRDAHKAAQAKISSVRSPGDNFRRRKGKGDDRYPSIGEFFQRRAETDLPTLPPPNVNKRSENSGELAGKSRSRK